MVELRLDDHWVMMRLTKRGLFDMNRLIGISGKLGSGKSSLAAHLLQCSRDPDVERQSFAERLRQVLSLMTNIPVEQTRSTEQKEYVVPGWDKSVGQLLQDMGEGMRTCAHQDAWILSLFAYFEPDSSYWIIDDVRFPNEADAIKRHGGLLIRLEGDPGGVRAKTRRNLLHPSETALDDYAGGFDAIINTEYFIGRWDDMCTEIERQVATGGGL